MCKCAQVHPYLVLRQIKCQISGLCSSLPWIVRSFVKIWKIYHIECSWNTNDCYHPTLFWDLLSWSPPSKQKSSSKIFISSSATLLNYMYNMFWMEACFIAWNHSRLLAKPLSWQQGLWISIEKYTLTLTEKSKQYFLEKKSMLWKKYGSASLRNMNPCPERYDTRRYFLLW